VVFFCAENKAGRRRGEWPLIIESCGKDARRGEAIDEPFFFADGRGQSTGHRLMVAYGFAYFFFPGEAGSRGFLDIHGSAGR
jgi:hypothetical protein